MPKKHEEQHENEERWLLTYADLITLLMAFFVVLYAMSKVDVEKFERLSASLNTAFTEGGVAPVPLPMESSYTGEKKTVIPREQEPLRPLGLEPEAPAEQLRKELSAILDLEGLQDDATIFISEDGKRVIVRLAASLLFLPGSDQLESQAQPLVDKIAAVVKRAQRPLRVEGHTDNVPISNAQFQSNWQLSAARAANVLVYLEQKFQLDPRLLSASGYGEHRPVGPNDTPENRAKNRRVEFVIEAEDVPTAAEVQPVAQAG